MGNSRSLATLGVNLALSQQAQQREQQRLDRDRDRQVADIRRRDAEATRAEDQALRQRLARERARAGASGTGLTGGSIDALLRGLEASSSADRAARQNRTQQQVESIRDSFADRQRRNLLSLTSRFVGGGSRSSSSRRNLFG